MRNWTKDQLAAIEARNCNLLVSAAAGSGKTALLIERIKRLVLFENTDVKELLVMTFTRAAASEMKERLRSALTQALTEPNADALRISEQLYSLNRASISTLDAFCTAFLREHFQSAGIDPDFKLGNETELKLLRREAVEEVLESYYAAIPEDELDDFGKMAEMYSENRDDGALIRLILDLSALLETLPDAEQWCEKAVSHFDFDDRDFFSSFWGGYIREYATEQLKTAKTFLYSAQNAADHEAVSQNVRILLENEAKQIDSIEQALEEGDFFKFVLALQNIVFKNYSGRSKTDEEKAIHDRIKNLRNTSKTILTELKNAYGSNPAESLSALKEMKKPVEMLIEVTRAYQAAYFEKKKAQSLLDFSDTERLTLQILKQNTAVRETLRQRYKYVFMDEYQDTNGMQEAILRCIVREDNYFMVGDVKQSIYRFRLADPGIFINKCHAFRNCDTSSDVHRDRLITLGQNFRSSKSVISSVNTVFEKVMSEKIGEVSYDTESRLYQGLAGGGPDYPTEIHLCLKKGQGDASAEEEGENLSKVEQEARYIATQIQNMIGQSLFRSREGIERPIKYSDIGILMRGVSGKGEVFKRVFKETGIPLYFNGGDIYFETNEVSLIINLLKIIDNPEQDLPLMAVLLSPIGGFTSVDCAMVREKTKCRYFHQAFWAYPNQQGEENEALKNKITDLRQMLETWRFELQITDIEDFLWKLYRQTGYYTFVGGLPGGEQRQHNLRQLMAKASAYKKMTMKGIFHFVRLVEDLRQRKMDDVPPGLLDGEDNAVQLMTIHKSKGLEFPIVIVADAACQINQSESKGMLLFHKELGLCPQCIRVENNQRFSTLAHAVCKEKLEKETLSEEMRLLYVAMTRAEEKLMMVGTFSQRSLTSRQKIWQEAPDIYHVSHVKGILDWVMMACAESSCFKVTDGEDRPVMSMVVAEKTKEQTTILSEDEKNRIIENLSWQYPYSESSVLPEKMTVTEINRYRQKKTLIYDLPDVSPRPVFMMQDIYEDSDSQKTYQWTAAEKGTAIHALLSDIDFQTLRNCSDLSACVETHADRMVKKEKLHKDLRACIDLSSVSAFFESDFGQRLLNADKIWREKPFNFAVEAGQIFDEWRGSQEKIILQGMIDCCFLEEDEWVLLDYKTDRYHNSEEAATLIDKYKTQLLLYAEALEKITERHVKEKVLVLLYGKEIISV